MAVMVTYRAISLIDASEEDELREEDGCHKVFVDAVQIGTQFMQNSQ